MIIFASRARFDVETRFLGHPPDRPPNPQTKKPGFFDNFGIDLTHSFADETEVTNNLKTFRPAHNAANYNKLKIDLRLTEKYGKAQRIELLDGRIRYYDLIKPAGTAGEMVGRRRVREWNPTTGKMRTWHETLDARGRIRQVRTETGLPKFHHLFDETGNYIKTWWKDEKGNIIERDAAGNYVVRNLN